MPASTVALSSALRPSPALRAAAAGRGSSRRSVVVHAKFEKAAKTVATVPRRRPRLPPRPRPPSGSSARTSTGTSSAVAAAEQRAARLEDGYTSIKGLDSDAEKARYARLCSKHPEAGRCQEGFSNKLVTKPATQSMVNGSMVRSDGIILVPGNREDLITWALDPKMSGDTLGLLLPTLFVIVGAQLKQVAGVPEYVSGAVGITTKLIATGLVALYWLPDFTAGLK